MRARYPGTCNLCDKGWDINAVIGRWTGRWVHRDCRDLAALEKVSQGKVSTLTPQRAWQVYQEVMKPRSRRGKQFS